MSGALEDLPETRLRAPMVEPAGYQVSSAIHAIAHPAAIALAQFLIQLQKAGTRSPRGGQHLRACQRARPGGTDELQKQTVGLLSFKPLAKHVFDAQVSFNMLAEYG